MVDDMVKNTVKNTAESTAGNMAEKETSVGKSAALMSLGTASSRILGMVRDMIIPALFSKSVMDVYFAAFRLPNLFRRLLGEGALTVSFIPVYVSTLENREKAKALSSAVFSILMVVSGMLSLLGILFMDQLIPLVLSGPGFLEVPGKVEQAISFGQIMFGYLWLVTTYAFLTAVANVHKSYFVPALAPAIFNVFCIGFSLVPEGLLGSQGHQLAWGVIAGGFAQVAMVGAALIRKGVLPTWKTNFQVEGVKKVLTNMVPGLLGLGVLQLMGLLNLHFSSHLPEGSISYIYLADRILELPQSLIAVSLGAALLPTLSQHFHAGRLREGIQTALTNFQLLLFLALPSAVGMFALALPISYVLFRRGSFSAEDAAATAMVIQIYSFLLIFLSSNKVFTSCFYAKKNTWLPALVSAVGLTFHYFLASYSVEHFGLRGLVFATTFSGFLNSLMLAVAFQKYFGSFGWSRVLQYLARLALPLTVLFGTAYYGFRWGLETLGGWETSQIYLAILLILTVLSAGVIYLYLARLFRVHEAVWFFGLLKRKGIHL